MHTGAIISNQRFWHECGSAARGMRRVMGRIFEHQHLVRLAGQCSELGTNLTLAGSTHFMVMHFNFDTHFLQYPANS